MTDMNMNMRNTKAKNTKANRLSTSSTIAIVVTLTAVVATTITTITLVYAAIISYDHMLKDSISILARIELAIEQSLHYARDYISLAVSFLLERMEEAVISKYKDNTAVVAVNFAYSIVGDRHVNAGKEYIAVGSRIEVYVEEGEEGKEEGE